MSVLMASKPYHVDLAELMRTYETNYAKLNALIPRQPNIGDVRCYQAAHLTYQLQVLEVTKYTTLVEICQSDDISIFPLPTMSVRLYHDARVAEVCASEQLGRVDARYDYPNDKMVQKDEKAQVNRFLGDWLTFCLKRGISRTPMNINHQQH
ncbi:DUF1249 family protein [Vibrio cincinnatiensis]|jgi:hypothetical protein|uniref:Dehydrogenase n=1 Tax=Vibrio cincinnatiensis DSM 19608 TaxID=1123491 RepID=A0A1T4PAC7_VIBCI|nr:DUF1249 family protein [Vibrio cincinnatiensis]MCG3723367.1 DUF1249 family protein [Vibrio cincinnatiensis]MCG3724506.1 DUF1249 family protein [Vibrio cincinnatiensis]MCG3731437.1 DUF1249 family protein [Vibrio cincinnatiensis]MCG3735181.1 DUF1249 family protein [Vibrio cincinnatiensis]MCG3739132.1 DUF1249 family protein [Vibrio cincinnatiensis]